jgi:hypothetical protein
LNEYDRGVAALVLCTLFGRTDNSTLLRDMVKERELNSVFTLFFNQKKKCIISKLSVIRLHTTLSKSRLHLSRTVRIYYEKFLETINTVPIKKKKKI